MTIVIPPDELVVRATRAGGPGGQHVNTSSTRIEIVWNIDRSALLTAAQRARLHEKLASRLDAEGNLRVVAAERDADELRGDLERFVFLLGGSDGETLFGLPRE